MDDLAAWLDRTLEFPVGADALPGVRARARLDMALTMAAIPVAASWGLVYLALGQPGAAIFPLVFALGTGGLLEYLWLTRDYYGFQQANLILGLSVAFGLQWYLGGYLGSGVVLLWGALAVRRALLFGSSNLADGGIIALVFLALFALLREGPMAPVAYPLTRQEIMGHFLLNLVGVSLLGHGAARYLAEATRLEEVRSDRLLRSVLPATLLSSEAGPARAGVATVLRLEVTGAESLAARGEALEELDEVVSEAGLVGLWEPEGRLLAIAWDAEAGAAFGGLIPLTAAFEVARRAAGLGACVAMSRGEVEGELVGEASPRYLLAGRPLEEARELLARGEAGQVRAGVAVAEALGGRAEAVVADDGGGGVWLDRRDRPGLRPERPRRSHKVRHPRPLGERVWRRR